MFRTNDWDSFPQLFFTTNDRTELRKYKFDRDEITSENILAFIEDANNKKVDMFLMSEPKPQQKKG